MDAHVLNFGNPDPLEYIRVTAMTASNYKLLRTFLTKWGTPKNILNMHLNQNVLLWFEHCDAAVGDDKSGDVIRIESDRFEGFKNVASVFYVPDEMVQVFAMTLIGNWNLAFN